jgi:aspartate/methionine/tyrosine aminotransferase
MADRPSTQLAHRLDEVGFSDIVQVRNKVMELKKAGHTVWGLHGGEPFFDTPEPIKQAMTQALNENHTRYASSSGIQPLREKLAAKLNERNHIPCKVEDVIVTSGGMHALYAAFQCVLDPGDDVLVFSPYWTPIRDCVTGAQARPLLVSTAGARETGIRKALAAHATEKTRAIYFNTPQNPSGLVFTRAEAQEVADFAKERDLIVIADEAYEDLVYDGEHVSIASVPGMFERTLTCYTFSKSFGMTGWRVGYLVAPEPYMTGIRKLVLYSINGVSTPSQYAALAALEMPLDFQAARLNDYRKRRDTIVAGLRELGFGIEPPAGAFYAFADASHINKDSRKAAGILLDQAHTAAIPGVVFGAQGEGFLRFGYATTMEQIEGALEAMKAAKL